MKYSMVNKLESLKKRLEEVEVCLRDPYLISNQDLFCSLSKEYSQLCNIMKYFQYWKNVQENIYIAESLLFDTEICNVIQKELQMLLCKKESLEKKLKILLLPKDVDDERGCFLEIRAGVGGNEAALFAGDLFRMYSRFSEIKDWKIKIISVSYGEYGGYKEIISKISYKGSYGILKFESGGHRVQRVPNTESQGRIHTSACTVVVMPELPEVEIRKINENDLRIDTFRSSGAGGQHVNTTDSAIRITHIPTGLVVECQDERSQHKNKKRAMSVLGARLRTIEIQRKRKEKSSIRRNILVNGDRSYRIRTYNFPNRRVTDHRIGLTLYRLEEIIEGNLDILIQPIINEYQSDQFSELFG